MGELEFSHFLQDFFYDISEPIARYFGRVYQYVGDEVVVTWNIKKGLRYAVCARCFLPCRNRSVVTGPTMKKDTAGYRNSKRPCMRQGGRIRSG
jgi:adenylate cyclase